jgi:hypothetical protein
VRICVEKVEEKSMMRALALDDQRKHSCQNDGAAYFWGGEYQRQQKEANAAAAAKATNNPTRFMFLSFASRCSALAF